MRAVEMRGPLKGFSNFVRSGEVKNLIAMNNHTALFAPVVGTFRSGCLDLFKLVTLLIPCIKALRTIAVV